MGIELQVIVLFGYNLLMVELFTIAALAWRYNGVATGGTGRLFGPFAFILASVIMRLNVTVLTMVMGSDLAEEPLWSMLGVAQLWGAVLVGGFVCEHMISRIRETGKVVRR